MGDVVGDAAEEEAAGAGHPLVADDDQVGVGFLGDVEDRLGGVALDRVGLDLDPLLAAAAAAAASRTRLTSSRGPISYWTSAGASRCSSASRLLETGAKALTMLSSAPASLASSIGLPHGLARRSQIHRFQPRCE